MVHSWFFPCSQPKCPIGHFESLVQLDETHHTLALVHLFLQIVFVWWFYQSHLGKSCPRKSELCFMSMTLSYCWTKGVLYHYRSCASWMYKEVPSFGPLMWVLYIMKPKFWPTSSIVKVVVLWNDILRKRYHILLPVLSRDTTLVNSRTIWLRK